MKNFKKYGVAVLILLAFGLIRWPLENGFLTDLRQRNLLEPQMEASVREKLGQTGAAVALGGLRSMVASGWNLRAHVYFTDQRWFDLEEAYKVTTTLQPRNQYYWDSGSWHLAYNASADYKNRRNLPPAIRRIKERDYIRKGTEFLEKGIRLNPDNTYLKGRMATLLTDRWKIQDFPRAASYLKEIVDSEDATDLWRRKYLYALARISDRSGEAYELATDLYYKDNKNRVPTLLCLIWVYQKQLNIQQPEFLTLEELFIDKETAFDTLETYYNRSSEGLPLTGVKETLRSLGEELGKQPSFLKST